VEEETLCKQLLELVVSPYGCGTWDHRAKPSCVAQHGTRFVLDEPSRFLGCVVRPLQ
jgi:hypothetical protein